MLPYPDNIDQLLLHRGRLELWQRHPAVVLAPVMEESCKSKQKKNKKKKKYEKFLVVNRSNIFAKAVFSLRTNKNVFKIQ